MGYLLLEGGAEFGGRMRDPDLKAIELAGGLDAPIRIIPTAAAPDNNNQRAGNNGIRWFERLGAKDVVSLPLIDKVTANDESITRSLREARLIYILGGFTRYLGETLKGSSAWKAVLEAYQNGAVVAGSSAGAMVMCEFYYDQNLGQVVDGLNLVPNSIVLPHHNTFGKSWASRLPPGDRSTAEPDLLRRRSHRFRFGPCRARRRVSCGHLATRPGTHTKFRRNW